MRQRASRHNESRWPVVHIGRHNRRGPRLGGTIGPPSREAGFAIGIWAVRRSNERRPEIGYIHALFISRHSVPSVIQTDPRPLLAGNLNTASTVRDVSKYDTFRRSQFTVKCQSHSTILFSVVGRNCKSCQKKIRSHLAVHSITNPRSRAFYHRVGEFLVTISTRAKPRRQSSRVVERDVVDRGGNQTRKHA
jgi:hypothetical protein